MNCWRCCASAGPRTRKPRVCSRRTSTGHDEMAGEEARGGQGREAPPSSGPDVTVEEAYAILGLAPGADEEAIREAHHRLMKQLHPDHGGTDYLAAKINRARDVLLHPR